MAVDTGTAHREHNQITHSASEESILIKHHETKVAASGCFAIFRYATKLDVAISIASLIPCGVGGTTQPPNMVAVGSMTGTFTDFLKTGTPPADFFTSLTTGTYGLSYVGERVTKKIRHAYLTTVLRQNIAFFDTTGAGEVAEGISQKTGLIVYAVVGFTCSIIIALVVYWQLALVMLCVPFGLVLLSVASGMTMKNTQSAASAEYSKSSTFAEEVISSIRNVVAYRSQGRFLAKYDVMLVPAQKFDFKAGLALSILQGHRFLKQDIGTVGNKITALFSRMIAGIHLVNAAPFFSAIGQASIAVARVFATIDRQSPIDPFSPHGTTLEKMVYSSRPNQIILNQFSLTIPAGKTVAVVGPSGSGKTTLFALLERLYPALQGDITLDGHPIDDLNIRWLRSQIGLVAQDNFLFNTPMYNDIAYGLGVQYGKLDDDKTMRLVKNAAKMANAQAFIEELPNGYHTLGGERGGRLSGGQRQRGAITHALSSAAEGRTTVIIAHRLSTVQKADMIVVMQDGLLIEQGIHHSLMATESAYASLVRAQGLHDRSGEEDDEPEESSKCSRLGQSQTLLSPKMKVVQCQMTSLRTAHNGGHSINFWTGMFLMLTIVTLLALGIQGYFLAKAGSALGSKAHSVAFAAILRQDIAFFDREENSSGDLAAFLAAEATKLTAISSNTLGLIMNSLLTIDGAVAESCSFGWKLFLVWTVTMPLILAAGFIRTWAVVQIERRFRRTTAAACIAAEAVSAIRTVAALTLEETISKQYAASMLASRTVVFSAQITSAIFAHSLDIAGAQEAAKRLKYLVESKSVIDGDADQGEKIHNLADEIELDKVSFAYTRRPENMVIKDISLGAKHGEFIALVSGSGSGKSTVPNHIERFYDPSSGAVLVDGQDIRELNLKAFRRDVALVEQEVGFIGGTIRHQVSLEEACRAANIYDFVVSLPEGLNAPTGARGNRVSGGQKQRLAIAKALLRNPKILVSISGRTTIAVAHRLSSIAHAHCIFVFDHGRIVEYGNHDQLMHKRGRYFELASLQQLGQ
ncbi:P-loop containing nucleoside triphosphate hydrolase protein [Podospora didyma]|uniref:P-loop containing nucleoside triphosphate hydrolase protein n=1 Tax=Podospora didyma TaxID=330526 RepID=A0AAE0NY66_9PEZI|nr:P-loop containing nucleoside triphosphate hydrolase protein [Podospora didyma]